jgi:hypothetical protein
MEAISTESPSPFFGYKCPQIAGSFLALAPRHIEELAVLTALIVSITASLYFLRRRELAEAASR